MPRTGLDKTVEQVVSKLHDKVEQEKDQVKPKKKPGPGRPKGRMNNSTLDVRQCILNAFERLGAEDWLVSIAKTDPKVFTSLLAKLLVAPGISITQGEGDKKQISISVSYDKKD